MIKYAIINIEKWVILLFIIDVCSSVPIEISGLISRCILLIKIFVPVALVVLGMIDFAKAVMANKEDEMKKAQSSFISRIIAAIVVFLIIVITQFVINLMDDNSASEAWSCANQIINGTAGSGSIDSTDDNTNVNDDDNGILTGTRIIYNDVIDCTNTGDFDGVLNSLKQASSSNNCDILFERGTDKKITVGGVTDQNGNPFNCPSSKKNEFSSDFNSIMANFSCTSPLSGN